MPFHELERQQHLPFTWVENSAYDLTVNIKKAATPMSSNMKVAAMFNTWNNEYPLCFIEARFYTNPILTPVSTLLFISLVHPPEKEV